MNEQTEKLLVLLQEENEANVRGQAWMQDLRRYLRHLLEHDMPGLWNLLYRIDVSEKQIALALENKPQTDADELLANLIWKRQLQKIETKKHFSIQKHDIPDEEAW